MNHQPTPIDRVLGLAKAQGLSDKELTRRSGIAVGLLSHAKKSGKLNLETLQAVGPVLGASVGELLGEEASAKPDAHYRRIPLGQLFKAPENERQKPLELAKEFEDGIAQLADDIAQRGLLQNLVVYQDGDDYFVVAGSRRLAAMERLDDRGELPAELAEHGIPCRLLADDGDALITSIVENLQRQDVHFMERADAFAKLRDGHGMKAPAIARAIGYDERMVQQHLQIHDKLDIASQLAARRGALSFSQCRDLVQEKKAKPAPEEPPPILAACGHAEPEPGSALASQTRKEARFAEDYAKLSDADFNATYADRQFLVPDARRAIEAEREKRLDEITIKPQPAPPRMAPKGAKMIRRDPDMAALEREIEGGLGLICRITTDGQLGWQLTLTGIDLDQFDHVLGLLLPNRGR